MPFTYLAPSQRSSFMLMLQGCTLRLLPVSKDLMLRCPSCVESIEYALCSSVFFKNVFYWHLNEQSMNESLLHTQKRGLLFYYINSHINSCIIPHIYTSQICRNVYIITNRSAWTTDLRLPQNKRPPSFQFMPMSAQHRTGV